MPKRSTVVIGRERFISRSIDSKIKEIGEILREVENLPEANKPESFLFILRSMMKRRASSEGPDNLDASNASKLNEVLKNFLEKAKEKYYEITGKEWKSNAEEEF